MTKFAADLVTEDVAGIPDWKPEYAETVASLAKRPDSQNNINMPRNAKGKAAYSMLSAYCINRTPDCLQAK